MLLLSPYGRSKRAPVKANHMGGWTMQAQQSSLLKRMYGSLEAARQAWDAQKQRKEDMKAARAYVRGKAPISPASHCVSQTET